jgi:hypothetical protein
MFKEKLFALCVQQIENQILEAQQAIESAQQAANQETKSSAGDKYETTRAMMQIEIENTTRRMNESQKLHQTLTKISFQDSYKQVSIGSLVTTNQGLFFVAIGIGKINLDNKEVYVISPNSPIGEKLQHQTVGHQFLVNGKNFQITHIQ